MDRFVKVGIAVVGRRIVGLSICPTPVQNLLGNIDPIVGLDLCLECLFLFLGTLHLSSARLKPLLQSLLLYNPVVLEVEIETLTDKEVPEHRYQILVVRLLIEF